MPTSCHNDRYQTGVGLLEIMLALAVAATLIVMSIRSYESFRAQADIRLIQENVQLIQEAGSAYYLANCSAPASLKLGEWQDLMVLNDYLTQATQIDNPLGNTYASGSYYQVAYQQVPNSSNYVFCVQINLNKPLLPNQFYRMLNATTYVGDSSSASFCEPSANSIAWQSLPSLTVPGYLNPQVLARLREFRKQNTKNWAAGCT